MSLSDAIEGVREKLDSASPKFLVNVCRLVTSTEVPDGFGGTTTTLTTVATDVPCSYKPLSNPMQRQIGGGPITTLTHVITMGSNSITKNIRPDYQIVIPAHDDFPELTFEQPVTMDGSLSPFIKLAAVLSE